MLSIDTIAEIKVMQAQGFRNATISRELHLDPKTVRKYMNQWDFSPQPPRIINRSSKLDPFKPTILDWLSPDGPEAPRTRPTAFSVYLRLLREYPDTFHGSYSTVRRFVRRIGRR